MALNYGVNANLVYLVLRRSTPSDCSIKSSGHCHMLA